MRFNPTALMGNHPMAKLLNIMQSGGNPNEIAQQLISSNPQLAKIAAGKTSDQIMSVAENMCRECGTTVDAELEKLGITR